MSEAKIKQKLALWDWTVHLFLLPDWIGPDLCGILFVETFDICMNVQIVGFPVVKMTNQQMMVSSFDFTEGNQVFGVKFQFRKKVEGLDVMNLETFAFVTAGHAGRFNLQMCSGYFWPLRAT